MLVSSMFQILQYLSSSNVLEERAMNIKPRGKQEEVMALPAKGHIVVLGTAGSGKRPLLCYALIILPTFLRAARCCLLRLIGR